MKREELNGKYTHSFVYWIDKSTKYKQYTRNTEIEREREKEREENQKQK